MAGIFTTSNTQHYLKLLSETSQDNGYAHCSSWHQIKMMVTGYLKQSFIQNVSQQKNSKLHEIKSQCLLRCLYLNVDKPSS